MDAFDLESTPNQVGTAIVRLNDGVIIKVE